ncbi:MAG: type II 3-dehydroquinate dehydratase [Xanthobacteraceae bacterium]|nr:type II 3-dehydroquinate dehydratase [Xanthobacteraceae bacterium]MBX3523402.1 type II 3-dehydroquinate dehydratase [Xanthobacteraceae bacterium]MBX3534055.1 type II 3-dehydroquinate dehydratase [Xanthobacteraceae bacterium]MBX3548788.1 type II 3-dehydroquinate dehydratase [Xanthobacteraceae bacterium]MCW5678736.1 type II 3-dehydroquinate dehydratase [Xanthobacteraceae bacterium]
MATVYVLNGPNLNLLGSRETAVYGATTLADIEKLCMDAGQRNGHSVVFRQSNHEGELVDWLQEANTKAAGVVINPGAYTHTSIALHDAIRAIGVPVIEVHLSNIFAREEFRHHSYVSPVARGVLCGFGPKGYELAIDGLANALKA